MRFLYVSFVEKTKQNSGILKKVVGQTRGVAELGWDARYICLDEDGVLLNDSGGGTVERKELSCHLRWRAKQNAVAEQICSFIREERYDVVYIKGFLANVYAYRIARCAKSEDPSCKVIFEIATYPYGGEYKRFFHVDIRNRDIRAFAGHLLEVVQHCETVPRMKRAVDTLVVFGKPVERLWGIPAVTLDNGVEVDSIPPREAESNAQGNEIRLLGVAGTSVAHGYFRILEGMAEYRQLQTADKPLVRFYLVGANETIQQLKKQADDLKVRENVAFLGYKNSQELSELYNQCDIAVSSIGVYRIGLTYLSPLKSREYCAAGIPFLYAYEDTLPPDAPFAMKIANDPSPVDIPSVVRFVRKCREKPEISRQERQFAKDHFDWKIIMERVLTVVCAAAKDKN